MTDLFRPSSHHDTPETNLFPNEHISPAPFDGVISDPNVLEHENMGVREFLARSKGKITDVIQRPIWSDHTKAWASQYKGFIIGGVTLILVIALALGLYFGLHHTSHPHMPHIHKQGTTVTHPEVAATVETGRVVMTDLSGNDLVSYAFGEKAKIVFYPGKGFNLHGLRQFQLIINDSIAASQTTEENNVTFSLPSVNPTTKRALIPDNKCYAQVRIMSGEKASFVYHTKKLFTIGQKLEWVPTSPGQTSGDQIRKGDIIDFQLQYLVEPLQPYLEPPDHWTLSYSKDKKTFTETSIDKVIVATDYKTITVQHTNELNVTETIYYQISYKFHAVANTLTTAFPIKIIGPPPRPATSTPSPSTPPPPVVPKPSMTKPVLLNAHGVGQGFYNQDQKVHMVFHANVRDGGTDLLKGTTWWYRIGSSDTYTQIHGIHNQIADFDGDLQAVSVTAIWNLPTHFAKTNAFQIKAIVNSTLSAESPTYIVQARFVISTFPSTIHVNRNVKDATHISNTLTLTAYPAFSFSEVWGSSPEVNFSVFDQNLNTVSISSHSTAGLNTYNLRERKGPDGTNVSGTVVASITISGANGYTVNASFNTDFVWLGYAEETSTLVYNNKSCIYFTRYPFQITADYSGIWSGSSGSFTYHFSFYTKDGKGQITTVIKGEDYYLGLDGDNVKLLSAEDSVGWTAIQSSVSSGSTKYKLKRDTRYIGFNQISITSSGYFGSVTSDVTLASIKDHSNTYFTEATAAEFVFPGAALPNS